MIITIYVIGCVLAFIILCTHVINEIKKGENIDNAPEMISVLTLCSWATIIMYIIRYIKFRTL